jgi:hypothetical protein
VHTRALANAKKDRSAVLQLLIIRHGEISLENGFKPPLLVLIVQHYHGSHPQRLLASAASRHLTLQILYESIGEMILRSRTASGFESARPAVRTRVLDTIVQRVAI